jgi:hypothetical protein
MCVHEDETVCVEWIDIDLCVLGNRAPLTPEAVEKKWRAMLQNGDAIWWPPICGHWLGSRFVVGDGRHTYVAALMRGCERVLVCWKWPGVEKNTGGVAAHAPHAA